MASKDKERLTQIAANLRGAAQMQDPIAMAAIEVLKLTIDDLKDSLVTADGDDMLRLQGATRHFQRLHKELTTTPPSIGSMEHPK